MKKTVLFLALLTGGFAACNNEENEDIVQQPNHEGAIETVVDVTHGAGFDLLTTTHKVWVKGNLDKTIVKTDTLRTLEKTMQDVEDSTGESHKTEVQKDYEFYITVK